MIEPPAVEWEFDVGVSTYDLLKRHVVVAEWRRVVVLAPSYVEGALLACQLAGSGDVVVTELLWRY
jgi:hypothetical protein